jgi:hypothetical protein
LVVGSAVTLCSILDGGLLISWAAVNFWRTLVHGRVVYGRRLHICDFNLTSHAHLFDEYGTVGQTAYHAVSFRCLHKRYVVRVISPSVSSDEPGKEILFTFPLSVSVAHVTPSRSPDQATEPCKNVLFPSPVLPTKNDQRSISLPFLESRVRAHNTAPHFPLRGKPHPNIVDLGTCEAANSVVGWVISGRSVVVLCVIVSSRTLQRDTARPTLRAPALRVAVVAAADDGGTRSTTRWRRMGEWR